MSWSTTPTRFILTEVDERGLRESEDGELLSVSEHRGVVPRRESASQQAASEDVSHYKRCEPGQLVLNKLWAFRGGLGVSPYTGLVSPAYAVYDINPRMDPKFVHYQTRSAWFVAEMTKRLRGIGSPDASVGRAPHLNTSELGSIEMYTPPLDTQRRIADMLDTETARIDTLIGMNERATELVDLRTLSLISECVKHGVPSKRPQIVNEYRGTTPAWLRGSVWPIVKLGLLFEVRGGTTPPSIEENWNGPVMWATPVDLRPVHGGSIAETIRTLSVSGAKSAGLIESPPGCIIVSCRAPVGYAAINTVPMTTNQGCKTLYPTTELDVRFFRYQLQAFRNEVESKGRGSTFVEVSSQALADFPVAVPPVTIQQSVANYLDVEIERHSAIRTAILYQQDLLRLRRQSLITAAVTGQIEA